ncbi:MAG: pyruvate kinase alpha/beta domain-containing protein [Thermoleophilia bacterium]
MQLETIYFEKKGRQNTEAVLEVVRRRAGELGIQKIVVPSTSGATGVLAASELSGYDVTVVTHSAGYKEPGELEVPAEEIERIRAAGANLVTATHAFGGVGRSVRRKFDTWQAEEIIAQTLKRFGEGVKVAVEVSLMACDAGFVSSAEEIISCGGTGHGLDTALVLRPANAQDFFEIKILELLCKPRNI